MLAALAVLFEFPFRPHDAPLALLATAAKGLHVNRLAVERVQLRLVLEGVHVAWPAVHEQENHALGLGRQRGVLGRKRVGPRGIPIGRHSLAVNEAFPAQQSGQRERREAAAHLVQKLTPRGAPAKRVPRHVVSFAHFSIVKLTD